MWGEDFNPPLLCVYHSAARKRAAALLPVPPFSARCSYARAEAVAEMEDGIRIWSTFIMLLI